MANIVAVHGISQQYLGEDVLGSLWTPSLRSGLRRAKQAEPDRFGTLQPDNVGLQVAFWGDLFRSAGTMGIGDTDYEVGDLDEWEVELLDKWWDEASRVEPDLVRSRDEPTMAGISTSIQRTLDQLSASRSFTRVAEWLLIGYLKQVHGYLLHDAIRVQVQDRLASIITPNTKVLIGHSLGSVIAYEALCAHPEWKLRLFLTFGSPLGIRNLIFHRLRPPPSDGTGVWPGSVQRWVNIADGRDVVALVKQLRTRFGERLEDILIDNGDRPHDMTRYLTAQETGHAIASSIAE
jgi:hypothetical protein